MGLKKEYVITEISAAPDGTPFVFITLKDPTELRGPHKTPSTSSMITFTSMDDVVRNLGRVISKQMISGFATVIKLSLDEYENLGFKVGDRISMEITQTQIRVP